MVKYGYQSIAIKETIPNMCFFISKQIKKHLNKSYLSVDPKKIDFLKNELFFKMVIKFDISH